MMNGSTAIWSKASYRQHQQEVGHDKPGLAAQTEQSGLAVPQVRQLPDPEHHFCTVVELELLYKSSTVGASLVLRRPIRSRTPPLRRKRCSSSRDP